MNFLNRTLVEIDFLSRQTMTFATGSRSSVGTIATITPSDGLTFVLLGAQICFTAGAFNQASENGTVELRNEANVRDILGGLGTAGGGSSSSINIQQAKSIIRGDILEGDGIKTYTLEYTVSTGLTLVGTLYGYLRNT